MNKKAYKVSVFILAIIWAIFAGIAFWLKHGLGTIATLGGIALMFAFDYEKMVLTD